MARAHASSVIDAPIEQVWNRIRDFDGLPNWHPGIAKSKVEGGKPSDQVGCVRVLTLQDGAVIREQLLEMSDLGHHYSYSILELPLPVANYRATLRLRRITRRQPHLRRVVRELRCQSRGEAGRDGGLHQQRRVPGRLRRAQQALRRLIAAARASRNSDRTQASRHVG